MSYIYDDWTTSSPLLATFSFLHRTRANGMIFVINRTHSHKVYNIWNKNIYHCGWFTTYVSLHNCDKPDNPCSYHQEIRSSITTYTIWWTVYGHVHCTSTSMPTLDTISSKYSQYNRAFLCFMSTHCVANHYVANDQILSSLPHTSTHCLHWKSKTVALELESLTLTTPRYAPWFILNSVFQHMFHKGFLLHDSFHGIMMVNCQQHKTLVCFHHHWHRHLCLLNSYWISLGTTSLIRLVTLLQ